MSETSPPPRKIAIVGNHNVGKSVLFGKISKDYSVVANYPYTTITVSRGSVTIDGQVYELIDTPGINSLAVQSEDELITRDILIKEDPDVIIQCADSTNLKRSLLLASDLMELGIPLVMCLNLSDENQQRGVSIDTERLSEVLDIPVVETVAPEGQGIKEVIKHIPKAKPGANGIPNRRVIVEALRDLADCFPEDKVPPQALLKLLLSKDPQIEREVEARYGQTTLEKALKVVAQVSRKTRNNIARILFEDKNTWASKIADDTTKTSSIARPASDTLNKIGELTRHPVWGWPILLAVVYATYFLVGEIGAGTLATFCDTYLFAPILGVVGQQVDSPFWQDFLVGKYGILSTGLFNALGTVLPILFMFFLVLNVLEDVGYISNLCILTDRLFRVIGLGGKSLLPLILGFGCRTMAILATKTVESRKERYIAIFLISLAVPCSAKLGINLAILSLLPFSNFLIVFATIALMGLISGYLLNRIMKQDTSSDFIMELPPFRLPQMHNLLSKMYYRLKSFLLEATPLFVVGAFLMFILDKTGTLLLIEKILAPLVETFLGLPLQSVDAMLLSIARYEAGGVLFMNMVKEGLFIPSQILVALIVLTALPCLASLMAVYKELGMRKAFVMMIIILTASFLVGGALRGLLML